MWINYEMDMQHDNIYCGCVILNNVMWWTISIFPCISEWTENYEFFNYSVFWETIRQSIWINSFASNCNLHINKAYFSQARCFITGKTNIILWWIYHGVNTQIVSFVRNSDTLWVWIEYNFWNFLNIYLMNLSKWNTVISVKWFLCEIWWLYLFI